MPRRGSHLTLNEWARRVLPQYKNGDFVALRFLYFGGSNDCPVWKFCAPDGKIVRLGLDWFNPPTVVEG